jgi:Maintenance of mitochondrial morphology protein 1
MFYDDAEQIEVRHVISLSYYDIDVFGGDDRILEGELFVKRNCIRMTPKADNDVIPKDAKPFYFFTTNCSEKEDFYHAMLQNQGRDGDRPAPIPLSFDEKHMEKLIYLLHASKAHYDTRWINALIGRVFLSLYKTSMVEQIVRNKINKKLSRVAKPTFITSLQIKNIDLGDSPPLITNPKLKEFSKAGDLTIEADITYKGNARIDVAAVARIDLGQRFKIREVQLLLAAICKSLEGHIYFRVKPPPSNRIWFSFETMPKMDLSVEPVVSSRQITYSLVLRAIESRLREVIAETLVQPNWDDVPFANTLEHPVRGGLWESDSAKASNARLSTATTVFEGEDIVIQDDSPVEGTEKLLHEEPIETVTKAIAGMTKRKNRRPSSTKTDKSDEVAVSSSAEPVQPATPRSFRSHSFASAATPVVSHDQAVMETLSGTSRTLGHDAASAMKDISSRSQSTTPNGSPVGSPSSSSLAQRLRGRSTPSTSKRRGTDADIVEGEEVSQDATTDQDMDSINKSLKDSDEASIMTESSSKTAQSLPISLGHKRQALASTAAAAKKWGLNLVNRHSPSSSVSSMNNGTSEQLIDEHQISSASAAKLASLLQGKDGLGTKENPIGRGQPLPPPGQPLPGPAKANRMTWTGPLSMLGRKNVNNDSKHASTSSLSLTPSTPLDTPQKPSQEESPRPPALPQRPQTPAQSPSVDDLAKGSSLPRPIQKPGLHSRRRNNAQNGDGYDQNGSGDDNNVLVIKAPDTDGDEDSLASYPSELGDHQDGSERQTSHSFPLDDLSEEPMGEMEGIISETLVAEPESEATTENGSMQINTQSEPSIDEHKTESIESSVASINQPAEKASNPASEETPLKATRLVSKDKPLETPNPVSEDKPLEAEPLSILTTNTELQLETEPPSEEIASPASTSSRSSTPFSMSKVDGRPRKIRSRQSLIPTPSSSRKHSPSERTYLESGRRTPMQELMRRTSSHSQEAGLGIDSALWEKKEV